MMWAKKLGPKHYMNGSTTLCGLPMLGNNYWNQRNDAPLCESCLGLKPIVWVDDDVPLLRSFIRLAGSKGFNVAGFSHPEDAIYHVKDGHPISLLISDYDMTPMNGVELVLRIRDIGKVDLPVLFVTGSSSLPYVENSLVVSKPASWDDLASCIEQLFGGGK
jgi:DNA-binding NtrC family response regulator